MSSLIRTPIITWKRNLSGRMVPQMIKYLMFIFAIFGNIKSTSRAFMQTKSPFRRTEVTIRKEAQTPKDSASYPTVAVNDFFKKPVPPAILEKIALKKNSSTSSSPPTSLDILSQILAPPSVPGTPRPLGLVILASIPTGLVWYGYYKYCIEEELLEMELEAGKTPRGFGGFGTLGPFTYGLIFGPLAAILHLPGGINWSTLGIIFIYYTQFLLYDRVNELYREEGWEEPLTVWWCWPIFFPFNLIVGLRQVHFLSQYYYRMSGMENPPLDPVVSFFPFIGAPKFTWQEFLTTPRLWCVLLEGVEDLKREELPPFMQDFLKLGDDVGTKKKDDVKIGKS